MKNKTLRLAQKALSSCFMSGIKIGDFLKEQVSFRFNIADCCGGVLSFADAAGASDPIISLHLTVAESAQDGRICSLEERVAQLYDELRPPLHRYLLSLGLAPEEVEEITQETFLRLYRHLHQGGDEGNLRSWIYQVAHNLAANFWRSRRRMIEATPEMWEQLCQSRPDSAPGPEEQFMRKERLSRVHRALTELTPLQRDCVYLRVEGFRYREIANILGVGTSTVAGSLRNAITRLAKEYS